MDDCISDSVIRQLYKLDKHGLYRFFYSCGTYYAEEITSGDVRPLKLAIVTPLTVEYFVRE